MDADDTELPRYACQCVATFGAALPRAAGVRPADADRILHILVEANLLGVDSHGVARLPFSVRRMVKGPINARPRRLGPAGCRPRPRRAARP